MSNIDPWSNPVTLLSLNSIDIMLNYLSHVIP